MSLSSNGIWIHAMCTVVSPSVIRTFVLATLLFIYIYYLIFAPCIKILYKALILCQTVQPLFIFLQTAVQAMNNFIEVETCVEVRESSS